MAAKRKLSFKEWLVQEVGTSTSSIAVFQRIIAMPIRRMWPTIITFGKDSFFEKKKKKKKKHKKKS